MNLKKYLLLITILLVSCESYNVRPLIIKLESKNDYTQILLNYKFHFLYPQSENLKKPIIKSLKNLKFKEINEIDKISNNDSYNLEIKIRYLEPLGIGIGMISALSFGIIPTYLSEHDMYGIKLILYKRTKKILEKEYVLRMKQFNWIFVAPAGIGNFCRREKIIDIIINEFFESCKKFI